MEQMQDICRGSVGPLPLDGANSSKCLIIVDRSMQFIIINLKKKYRINSFLMQELKLYMA